MRPTVHAKVSATAAGGQQAVAPRAWQVACMAAWRRVCILDIHVRGAAPPRARAREPRAAAGEGRASVRVGAGVVGGLPVGKKDR
jgi:hypothetical protein